MRDFNVIGIDPDENGVGKPAFELDKPVTEIRRPVSIKLPAKVYHRYFANTAAKDVQSILEEALDLYFERKGA